MNDNSKTYKVSYKTYFNERLKKVDFHGRETYPLYIQVTFDRRTLFFKSYYFELFSKPRYRLLAAGMQGGPSIDAVIEKEKEVLDFVADRVIDNFSLERFKEAYLYYSADLCDVTEPGFVDYLYTFLYDKGMPDLAFSIREGCKYRIAYDVVKDMKGAFDKQLYEELVQNSFYYGPPYLASFRFMKEMKRWPMLCLSVMEWKESGQKGYNEYIEKYYGSLAINNPTEQVNNWLSTFGTQITSH